MRLGGLHGTVRFLPGRGELFLTYSTSLRDFSNESQMVRWSRRRAGGLSFSRRGS